MQKKKLSIFPPISGMTDEKIAPNTGSIIIINTNFRLKCYESLCDIFLLGEQDWAQVLVNGLSIGDGSATKHSEKLTTK